MAALARTSLGRLEGLEQAGVLAFRGVPYAAPPVGPLRFRAPAPVAAWHGVRDARLPGPTAPQAPGVMRDLAPQDEDCLYLNLWTPGIDARRRPVMVFIHGGGFTTGASTHPMYEGRELARRGDVVVVSFNYRLGALGFADLAALQAPGFEADANAGLRDQLAALRFVQDHVADFGGDPEQVTVFGQSAGAMSVCTLITLPAARGLFRRAIAQSGAAHHVTTRAESSRIAARLTEALRVEPTQLARLRELPYQALVQAQSACLRQWIEVGARARPLRNANMTLLPVVDGELIPEPPIEAAAQGAGAELPLLIGTNRDEYHFWIFVTDPTKRELREDGLLRAVDKRLPGHAARVVQTYRELPGGAHLQPWRVFSAIETDRIFRVPGLRLAQARAAGPAPTFVYELDFEGPLFEGQMGACHTMDVPLSLGLVDEGFGKVFTGGGPGPRALSERMMDAWLAFARSGDPSTEALGAWPRHPGGAMRLGARCAIAEPMLPPLERLWSALL